MLKALVYSFAAVAMLLCIAAVGFYIYIVRLPVTDYVNKGKQFVQKGGEIIRNAKSAGKALDGVREELQRVTGSGQPQSPVPVTADKAAAPEVAQKTAAETPKGDTSQTTPVAAEKPATPTQDKTLSATAPSPTVYVVQQKDTLYGLAAKFYGDGNRWKEIAAANKLDAPYFLRPGMKLTIPSPETVTADAPSFKPAVETSTFKPGEPVYMTGGRGL